MTELCRGHKALVAKLKAGGVRPEELVAPTGSSQINARLGDDRLVATWIYKGSSGKVQFSSCYIYEAATGRCRAANSRSMNQFVDAWLAKKA